MQQVFIVEKQWDWEGSTTISVCDSFDKVVEVITAYLNGRVERPDRVDNMSGVTTPKAPYSIGSDRISVNMCLMNDIEDRNSTRTDRVWWNLYEQDAINHAYTVEFAKNGGYFSVDVVKSLLKKSTYNSKEGVVHYD